MITGCSLVRQLGCSVLSILQSPNCRWYYNLTLAKAIQLLPQPLITMAFPGEISFGQERVDKSLGIHGFYVHQHFVDLVSYDQFPWTRLSGERTDKWCFWTPTLSTRFWGLWPHWGTAVVWSSAWVTVHSHSLFISNYAFFLKGCSDWLYKAWTTEDTICRKTARSTLLLLNADFSTCLCLIPSYHVNIMFLKCFIISVSMAKIKTSSQATPYILLPGFLGEIPWFLLATNISHIWSSY